MCCSLPHQSGCPTEFGVADGGLDDFQLRGRGLELVVEEGDVVSIARRVDADADVDRRIFVLNRLIELR